MDIRENPFYRINARAHQNRAKLLDLADTRGLVGDPEDASRALADLTNPRRRLAAEVAWFPGVLAAQVDALLGILKSPPQLLSGERMLPPQGMARANLMAAGLLRLEGEDRTPSSVAVWIMEISLAFENTDPETLMMIINQERVVSGFPEVTDLSAVRNELNERRRYFRSVITAAMSGMNGRDRLETIMKVVRSSTADGSRQAPEVVFDMVDLYEVESKAKITQQERDLQFLMARIRDAAERNQGDFDVANLIGGILTDLRGWRQVTEPTHICARLRGLKSSRDALMNSASELEARISALGRTELAASLADGLRHVFADEWESLERQDEAETEPERPSTRETAAERIPARAQDPGPREEILLEADVELILKEKIKVSSEWIEWQGRRWDLSSITRMRWGRIPDAGGDVHSVTSYRVYWGDDAGFTSLDFINGRSYERLVRALWKATGLKLLYRILALLRAGSGYRFGGSLANDAGIELERHGSPGERVFCKWSELVIMDEPGVFCLGHKGDNTLWADFKYLEEDNINLLENAVRMRAKRGGDRLSSLLPTEQQAAKFVA
jgi:hypothetical protein